MPAITHLFNHKEQGPRHNWTCSVAVGLDNRVNTVKELLNLVPNNSVFTCTAQPAEPQSSFVRLLRELVLCSSSTASKWKKVQILSGIRNSWRKFSAYTLPHACPSILTLCKCFSIGGQSIDIGTCSYTAHIN